MAQNSKQPEKRSMYIHSQWVKQQSCTRALMYITQQSGCVGQRFVYISSDWCKSLKILNKQKRSMYIHSQLLCTVEQKPIHLSIFLVAKSRRHRIPHSGRSMNISFFAPGGESKDLANIRRAFCVLHSWRLEARRDNGSLRYGALWPFVRQAI